MTAISANELKTRGVAAIESALANEPEAAISVRGRVRYVVMPVERFHHFRECELESALLQTRADLAAGQAVLGGAETHLERLRAASEE
jgi:hypothetical protein